MRVMTTSVQKSTCERTRALCNGKDVSRSTSVFAALALFLIMVISAFGIASSFAIAVADMPGAFTETGSMQTARANHTATLLPTGKVLVAGGFQTASAELYDPLTRTFMMTGALLTARANHTA